jgi:DNA-binding Lrp family transcriptional regulator
MVDQLSSAFVLINSQMGHEKEVLESLNAIPEIKEAYTVYGVYDIVARVETERIQELKDVIHQKIRKLELIRSTITLIEMD